MELSAGTRLGPYEILVPLGAGGMGEVYRATDTKLGREVAIKVLPAEMAGDAERLARFQREAQVLASLNHPNIAAIYGLEEAAGTLFIALELVEGQDLKERLARGAIPVAEALGIARQIAEGLEEAHEKGIVHRDLKPANVKVTPDGKVKVLDFGLAKAWTGDGAGGTSSADLSQSPTLAHTGTAAGIILGTAAYMSPEQARGKAVDKRADIWAFGVVLWEMLTGQRLFEGETVSDVMAAVLKNEPDWGALPKNVGPATRRLLARCLEKNPGRRYRDIGDVAFDLDAGPAAAGEHSTMPSGAARTTGRLAWATAGLAVAVAIALGALLWRQHSAQPSPPTFEKLTFAPLFITNARFAPDGRTVVFSAAREGNTSELFVRHPEDPQPKQLGEANVQLLSVSSKGELAVLTGTRFRSHRSYVGTLARMPLAEASPREVLNDVTGADWSPDGTELAIIRQVSGRSHLEYPIGTVLAEATGYISDVRVSPGGDLVAFMPHAFEWDDRGPVVVVDREGAVVAKSPEYWGVEGVAWSADGAAVLFAATDPPAPYAVRELALDGTVRNVLNGPTGLVICDRTPDGKLLVSTYTFTNVLSALFPDASAERELPWREASIVPVLSRDGRRLLFTDQSPLAGLDFSTYLRPTDDSPPVRLGEGLGVDLSPDGASVLVGVMSDPPRLMIYPTGAGEPRDISAAGFVSYDFRLARFLANEQGVAFCGAEAGKASRCYVRDLAGGAARAVTPEGTDHGLVSPDGSAVVARGTNGRYQLFPLDGSEPVPVPGLDDEDYPITWRQDGRSLLVYRPMEIPTRVERLDLSTGERTLVRELAPVDRVGANAVYGVSFSVDEKSYAYAFERILGALYSVEGVR